MGREHNKISHLKERKVPYPKMQKFINGNFKSKSYESATGAATTSARKDLCMFISM